MDYQQCPDANKAHQMSWHAMEAKVANYVREGDEIGLRRFLKEFEQANSLVDQLKGAGKSFPTIRVETGIYSQQH